MERVLGLLVVVLLPACASPPTTASAPSALTAPAAPAGSMGTLSPAFRDYRIGTRRTGGACTPATGNLRYVEVLDLLDAPAVVLGLDGSGCIAEVRTSVGTGVFAHAVALATQRLGPPDGEERAQCEGAGTPLQRVYWDQPQGRFGVVRAGVPGRPEFVLQTAGAPLVSPRLCDEGGGR